MDLLVINIDKSILLCVLSQEMIPVDRSDFTNMDFLNIISLYSTISLICLNSLFVLVGGHLFNSCTKTINAKGISTVIYAYILIFRKQYCNSLWLQEVWRWAIADGSGVPPHGRRSAAPTTSPASSASTSALPWPCLVELPGWQTCEPPPGPPQARLWHSRVGLRLRVILPSTLR